MRNWKELSKTECAPVWDYVYHNLLFKPNKKSSMKILLPKPSMCYDLSPFYGDGFKDELYEDLHEVTRKNFKLITNKERWYALNWQHECYSFTAMMPFEKDNFNEWLIPVFPNGDYVFFLSHDFKNGIFGDGIDLSISLLGQGIIKAFKINQPKILSISVPCNYK